MAKSSLGLRDAISRGNAMDSDRDVLLELGQAWCPTDYAVRFFHAPEHPKFFGNTPALIKALRRAADRLPKSQRAKALQCIEEARKVWITSDEAFKQTVFNAEQKLIRVLLSLSDAQLFDLYDKVDFGDNLEDEDYWLETMGVGFVEEGEGDNMEIVKKPVVESLHAHLEVLLLRGKKRHHEIAWIAYGLATINTSVSTEGMPGIDTISCRYDEIAECVTLQFPDNPGTGN